MRPQQTVKALTASILFSATLALAGAGQTVLDLSKGSIVITDAAVTGFAPDGSAVTTPNLTGGYKIIQSVLDSTKNTVQVGSASATLLSPLPVTISGLNIRLSDGTQYASVGTTAMRISSGYVQLTLENDNYIQSGLQAAGINTYRGGTPIITGTGSLKVNGGYGASGITGAIINGGNLLVNGGYDCSAIGYAIVNGGVLTVNGGYDAAGIGGCYGEDGSAEINGGVVTANGGYGAPGLGAGGNNNAISKKPIGTVKITGGMVTSFGGYDAADIGGGSKGSGVVTITGGTVIAGSIGTGIGGDSSKIKISGGSVWASRLYSAKDLNGVTVYHTVIANLEPNMPITALNLPNYGTTDMQTSAHGDIDVYLPLGAVTGALSTAHINYSLSGRANDTIHATVASITQEYKTSKAPIVVGNSNWYKDSVVIKPVPGSGYTKIGIADGSGAVATWLDSIVIKTEAVDAVASFRSKDSAGVLSAVRQLTYSLDLTKPTGTITVGGVADEFDNLTYQLYSHDTLTFTIGGIADASSGVAKAQYSLCRTLGNSGSCDLAQSCSNGSVIKVAPTISGYMNLTVTDIAGNRNEISSKKFLTMKDATVDTTAITVNQDALPSAITIPTTLNGLALQHLILGKDTIPVANYFVYLNKVDLYSKLFSALPGGQDTIVFLFASPSTPDAPEKYLSKPYLVVNVTGSVNSSSSSSSSDSSSSSASSVLAANAVAGPFHISAAPLGVLVESDRSMAIEVRNLRGELLANIELHQGLNHIRLPRGVYIIGKQQFAVMQ